MNNSNKKKHDTLGMPHGTAVGRLRKNILFHLLQKLNEDICFKCNKKIEKVEELSIEHKLPWEGRDAKLFWDLNNIAFSHLRCNRPETNGQIYLRKNAPDGIAWCGTHQKFLPIENFGKDNFHWNGLKKICKDCKSIENAQRIR